jgi:hypothetical protein
VSFARNFYCERNPRGYVIAGVSGSGIEVVIEMNPEVKERLGHELDWSEEVAKRWDDEMNRLAATAEARVRRAWREQRKAARR